VRQTPSQATDKPISFLVNLKSLFTNILIPFGLFDIFETSRLLHCCCPNDQTESDLVQEVSCVVNHVK